MLQLLKTSLEEVLLDSQLSLQLSDKAYMKQKLSTAGASDAAVKTNLEEVLLDGQLSLQLSEEGIHEAKAVHSWG